VTLSPDGHDQEGVISPVIKGYETGLSLLVRLVLDCSTPL